MPDLFGVVYGYSSSHEGKVKEERKEMFYMRIGQMSFRQNWVEREVSSSLTLTVCLLILALGILIGFVVGKWVDLVLFGVGVSSGGCAVGFVGMDLVGSSETGSTGVVVGSAAGEGVSVVVGWDYHHGRNSGTEYRGSWLLA